MTEPNLPEALASVIQEAQEATAAWSSPEAVAARAVEEARTRAQRDANHVAEWRANLRRYAPIPEWHVAWEAEKTSAVKVVDTWLSEGCPKHLFLFGPVGVGKSIAAAHAVKRWVEPGTFEGEQPVSWLRPSQVVSAVFHAYAADAPRLGRRIVIEDIGYRRMPEDFEDAMCDLFDRQELTIIATLNMTSAEFNERFSDPRFRDRLNHRARAFRLKGKSRRKDEGGFKWDEPTQPDE